MTTSAHGKAFLCLALALVGLSGCAIFGSSGVGGGRPIDSARGGDPSVTPFKLEVLEERNNGETMVIKGQVVPKTSWSSEQVMVRLAAVDEAGEQLTSYHKLNDLNPNRKDLLAGQPVAFSLSLPSRGLSNYQLEVLWGNDAAQYSTAPKASLKQPQAPREFLALQGLEVHRVPDGSCSSPEECLVRFSIKGEFFNSGSATIQNVMLLAGFSPADKLDLPDQILENERRIEVRNLNLAAGAKKPFRLTLEKYVPASDTVAYQPVVRIVSFGNE
jgi:hypothetical protein